MYISNYLLIIKRLILNDFNKNTHATESLSLESEKVNQILRVKGGLFISSNIQFVVHVFTKQVWCDVVD